MAYVGKDCAFQVMRELAEVLHNWSADAQRVVRAIEKSYCACTLDCTVLALWSASSVIQVQKAEQSEKEAASCFWKDGNTATRLCKMPRE